MNGFAGKKILVTGGAGFLGGPLIRNLVERGARFEVDTRGHLGKLHPVLCEGEDAALRDVEHGLSFLGGVLAAEGDLLDLLEELAFTALLFDL